MNFLGKVKLETLKSWSIGLIIPAFLGCTTFEGQYEDPAKKEILDDKWNPTDARKTAEVLIKGLVSKPWLTEFKRTHGGKKPILMVDEIANRTDEHIDTKSLTEYIRDELINSGKVRFVNAAKRQKILDEVKYQQSGAVRADMAKKLGKQIGADFFVGGAIASQVHSQDKVKTVNYQTNLILTNLETAEIVFSQKHQIKKRFKRASAGW